VLALRLEQHPLIQVAQDGRFLPAPTDHDQIVLAPANRADLIIRPTIVGQYALITDPYQRGTGMMGMMGSGGHPARSPWPSTGRPAPPRHYLRPCPPRPSRRDPSTGNDSSPSPWTWVAWG